MLCRLYTGLRTWPNSLRAYGAAELWDEQLVRLVSSSFRRRLAPYHESFLLDLGACVLAIHYEEALYILGLSSVYIFTFKQSRTCDKKVGNWPISGTELYSEKCTVQSVVKIRSRGTYGQIGEMSLSRDFIYLFISEARTEIRPFDRFWRIMAQNARNHARMCLR